jgi:hypothetical protein
LFPLAISSPLARFTLSGDRLTLKDQWKKWNGAGCLPHEQIVQIMAMLIKLCLANSLEQQAHCSSL